MTIIRSVGLILLFAVAACRGAGTQPPPAPSAPAPVDPLPSWNEGPSKSALTGFVGRVTQQGGRDFVPEAARIAVFDNDGTLWSEQPMYFQLAFAIDRVKQLAPQHPEWKNKPPFKGILDGDMKAAMASGEKGLLEIIAATHAGTTTDEFAGIVSEWIQTAKHPTLGRPYNELVYQPMLEVLAYLRANGFKTYIVSGGGLEFMRPWVEATYGIPPEQVVGSRAKVEYAVRDGQPELRRLAAIDLIDDGAGKPVGIHQVIGRRPVMAFGNSDGDFQMLEWTTTAPGARFALIVHHTDAEREWAYDRESHIGRLVKGLDQAAARNWIVADMAKEWKVIYPFQKKP
jgi:phosphoglycolate phosphatase-like HAD superfamily hydrolase